MWRETTLAAALLPLLTRPGTLPLALSVLRHAPCGVCSLGATGLRDGVLRGPHLCGRRVRALLDDLAEPIPDTLLADIARLPRDEDELRRIGRLARPLVRRAGDAGFRPISWEDAAHLAGARLRDARVGTTAAMVVNPAGLHLETLVQLRRVGEALFRRARGPGDVPGVVVVLPTRAEEGAPLGAATRRPADRGLDTFDAGDSVAVVARAGDHPLLPQTVRALRRRGVLAVRVEAGTAPPADVRATLAFGPPGASAARAAGLSLASIAPARLGELDAAYVVGPMDAARREALRSVPARIHQHTHLDEAMLEPAPEFVLLLPALAAHEHPGGGTFLADDGRTHAGPEVRGSTAAEARPHWQIPVLVLALLDPDAARALAVDEAGELAL